MLDAIGWLATAVFSASYFFREPGALRRIQAVAACLWVAYGLPIGAVPVVAANVIGSRGGALLVVAAARIGTDSRSNRGPRA